MNWSRSAPNKVRCPRRVGNPHVTPSGYQILIGDRVLQEAQAQSAGINNYFNK